MGNLVEVGEGRHQHQVPGPQRRYHSLRLRQQRPRRVPARARGRDREVPARAPAAPEVLACAGALVRAGGSGEWLTG